MMDKFRELCGDCGGYEGDFMYMCSFIVSMDSQLKFPQWTFVGLRTALNLSMHDTMLRDIMRRCFVLAGRNIIGGVDDAHDSRMDRAIVRLLTDREFEASVLFPDDSVPDMSGGFLSLPTDSRLRLVRFIMQSVFEAPHVGLSAAGERQDPFVGLDANDNRYFLMKDTALEVGCWKELSGSYQVELVATSTDEISLLASRLMNDTVPPERSNNACVYCRKKTSDSDIRCAGCTAGSCHFKCMPASELNGLMWTCSPGCRQVHLASVLRAFVAEIEPQQKAAMRKRRRIAGELHALQINSQEYQADGLRRSTRERRVVGQPDYSFRDYEKSISQAIRRSERRSENASSEEEAPYVPVSHSLTREERMALREKKQEQVKSQRVQYSVHGTEGELAASSDMEVEQGDVDQNRSYEYAGHVDDDFRTRDPMAQTESVGEHNDYYQRHDEIGPIDIETSGSGFPLKNPASDTQDS